MVLSDKEIYKALNKGDLMFVTPDDSLCFDIVKQVQPASIDLRLSNRVYTLKSDVQEIDITKLDNIKAAHEIRYLSRSDTILLQPGELFFSDTFEQIKLPNYTIGLISGKSRLARVGLAVHIANFINPGFNGVMPLQIKNQSNVPMRITPYELVCQLILFDLKSHPLLPYQERTTNPYYKEFISTMSSMDNESSFVNSTLYYDAIKLEEHKHRIKRFLETLDGEGQETLKKYLSTSSTNEYLGPKIEIININSGNDSKNNFGGLLVSINKNLEELNANSNYEVSSALHELTEAIVRSNSIQQENQIEYLDFLKYFSEEALKPKQKWNKALIKTAYGVLSGVLGRSADIAKIWDVFGPQLKSFFASTFS